MTGPNPLRRFRLVALLLVAILLVGTVGYRFLEGWDWLDSFLSGRHHSDDGRP